MSTAFFREMTLRICGSLDIDQALEATFEYLHELVPADTMALGFNNLDQASPVGGPRIFVVAKVARPGARFIWLDEADDFPLSPEAAAFNRSLPPDFPAAFAVNHPDEQHPSMRALFPGVAAGNSALFVRLEVHGGLAGVLLLSVSGHHRYNDEHVRLLQSVSKPFAIAMANARRFQELLRLKERLAEDNRALSADIKRSVGLVVVGADFGLRHVMDQVRQVAPSSSPTLLLGETGTGKEIVAQAIHLASTRHGGPMVTMQCGAIPETLLDSELFGHERGAFTGALERKRGRFERADGGTLFLDEIGELSPDAQVKLLRVLQERCFERVGGTKTLQVDVRVIAATHRDLENMVRQGRFREDLWYRLNVFPIRIPPLRLRREDIPSLVQYFIERKSGEMNLPIPTVSPRDLRRLEAYDWPGNVRELQNIVERALLLSRGGPLTFPELATAVATGTTPVSSRPATQQRLLSMDEATAAHIREALEHTRWKVSGPGGAAEQLKMNPSTLRFRMEKLGIRRDRG